MGESRAKAAHVLAVDVGNTVTRLGLFDGGCLSATGDVTTPAFLTADEAGLAVFNFVQRKERSASTCEAGGMQLVDAILSCVVPDLADTWVRALHAACGRRPLVVGPGLKTGVKMRYRDPAEVGPDRVADLVAARADYRSPLMVVDLGTTTTFEVLDEQGTFLGGLISPGLALGAKSLAQAAARLPHVELKAPPSVIGTSTREAMQAGIVMGEVARIDGIIDMVVAELSYEPEVVVTGANAPAMAALLRHRVCVDDTLTLRGLGYLYEMNRRK